MRTSAALLVLVTCTGAFAQETPRQLIERAIVAHGGRDKLARARSDRVKLQGTLHVGSRSLPFSNEQAIQLPGQYRSVVRITQGERAHTVVHLLDGDKAALYLDGQEQRVTGGQLAQMRQTLQLDQAMKLVPLLTDSRFTLHPLGRFQHNGRVVIGLRVQGRIQRDLKMFFDQETALLVKTQHSLDGPGGKDVLQEAFYGEYREMGGHRRPSKIVVYRDGKMVMRAELVEARVVDRIDPLEFGRP